MIRRPPYLSQVSLEEASRRWEQAMIDAGVSPRTSPETILTPHARGRVLAGPVFARYSSPAYHACAMDGYAVSTAATVGASDSTPVQLVLGRSAWYVDTGDHLPAGADAVVMIEDVEAAPECAGADAAIELRAAAVPWQHVRPVGEDIAAGELLLPVGWRLRGTDVAVLVSAGVAEVPVRARPRVTVIPTGDEIVGLESLGERGPAPGQVIESNSLLVAGVTEEAGGVCEVAPVAPDDRGAIRAAVEAALGRADVVVVSAGSSAGSGDFVAEALGALGEVVVHGVATRPGKPVILAVCGGRPVLGMPGYPVSAWVSLDNFLRPLLLRLLGAPPAVRGKLEARLGRRMPSPAGVREYLRVQLGRVTATEPEEQAGRPGARRQTPYVAAPLTRGAGVLSSLVRADAIIEVPPDREGYEAGAVIRAALLRPRSEIDASVVAIGSHDLSLDILGNLYRDRYPGASLSSANAGSMAGLQALARGEAHIAGTHLLDPATGDYNVTDVRRLLPGRRMALVCLAMRQQGLLVARGNPLGLRSVADLAQAGVRYINRQRGAGTRVLLDYLLGGLGIAPESVAGYRREVFTHLAVAAEVAAGGADAGMGILAAARAAGLDFVPVTEERYELALPAEAVDEPRIARLIELAGSENFRQAVEAMGGYDTRPAGEIRWVEPV